MTEIVRAKPVLTDADVACERCGSPANDEPEGPAWCSHEGYPLCSDCALPPTGEPGCRECIENAREDHAVDMAREDW